MTAAVSVPGFAEVRPDWGTAPIKAETVPERFRLAAERFTTEAKLARAAAVAAIPVSSGKTNRHRLDGGGERQLNVTLHRVATAKAECDPETKACIGRNNLCGPRKARHCVLGIH